LKNYRLTQRGKIVFTGLFIALIVALVLMVLQFNKKIDPVSKELKINTGEIEMNNEKTEDAFEKNMMDNDDEIVEISTDPSIEVEIETVVETSEVENMVDKNDLEILYTLFYAPDKYRINEKNVVILDNYYELAIKKNSGIIIEGNYHLGKDYDEKMFAHLSYERAVNVKEYLVKKGIEKNRITIIDNKNLKPLNKDRSNSEVELNRRVDIYFEDFYK